MNSISTRLSALVRRTAVAAAATLAIVAGTGCSGDDAKRVTGPSPSPDPVVTRIDVSPEDLTFSSLDSERQMLAIAYDQEDRAMPGTPVVWSSTDLAVVSVTPDGLATPHGTGTAEIRATYADVVGSVEVSVNITHTPASAVVSGVRINGILASASDSVDLEPGEQLEVTYMYSLRNQSDCLDCVSQIVLGLDGGQAVCIYDDAPGDGAQGIGTVYLTVPDTPGARAALRYGFEQASSCDAAVAAFQLDPPADGVLGVVNVMRGFSGAYDPTAFGAGYVAGGTAAMTGVDGEFDSAVISYDVDLGTGGVSHRTATFVAGTPNAGTITFDWTYSGFHAYSTAHAFLRFAGDHSETIAVDEGTWELFEFSGTASVDVDADGRFLIEVGGSNHDSTSIIRGELTLTNFRAP